MLHAHAHSFNDAPVLTCKGQGAKGLEWLMREAQAVAHVEC